MVEYGGVVLWCSMEQNGIAMVESSEVKRGTAKV